MKEAKARHRVVALWKEELVIKYYLKLELILVYLTDIFKEKNRCMFLNIELYVLEWCIRCFTTKPIHKRSIKKLIRLRIELAI